MKDLNWLKMESFSSEHSSNFSLRLTSSTAVSLDLKYIFCEWHIRTKLWYLRKSCLKTSIEETSNPSTCRNSRSGKCWRAVWKALSAISLALRRQRYLRGWTWLKFVKLSISFTSKLKNKINRECIYSQNWL